MLDCICPKHRSDALPASPSLLSSRGQLTISSAKGLALPHIRRSAHLEDGATHEFPPRKTPESSRASQKPVFQSFPLKTFGNRKPSWVPPGAILSLRRNEWFPDLRWRVARAGFSSIRPCCKHKPCSCLQGQERSWHLDSGLSPRIDRTREGHCGVSGWVGLDSGMHFRVDHLLVQTAVPKLFVPRGAPSPVEGVVLASNLSGLISLAAKLCPSAKQHTRKRD
jgi:hypothetical protein